MTKSNAMKQNGGERLEALRKKLRDDPRSLAFVELAEELTRQGHNAEASEVAQRGLLSHPDSVAGRLALAVAEAEQDHIREALEQIKRALLIDQENPKALALMGRILLKKGLAKRAVQFLSHAVKLDPKAKEYGTLLKEARRLAKSEQDSASVPVFDGDQVPDSGSPWTEDDPSTAGEADHTVFDPEALRKLRSKDKKKNLDDALSELPSMGDGGTDEEPTKFAGKGAGELPPPRRVDEEADLREEPTKFAAKNPLEQRRKAKMGGSAKDFSQMMKRADVAEAREEAEKRLRAQPKKAPVSDLNLDPQPAEEEPPPPKADVRPAPKAPSVERELRTSSERPSEKKPPAEPKAEAAPPPPPAPPPEEKKPEPPKAEKPPKPKPAPKAPSGGKAIGHVATRMVDEALWDLLGGKSEEPAGKRPEPDEPERKPASPKADRKPASAKAKPERPAKGKAAPEPQKQGGPMVVRTSERFGVWTSYAVLLILCVTAAWVGYAVMISGASSSPEVATEELKGLAADLETGGLAKLLAAEEKAIELERSNPDLAVLMHGVLAEVYARRWDGFGRDPKMLEQAKAQVSQFKGERASVELLAAMTVLSTGAESRTSIDQELKATLSEYSQSPKIWVLRARIAKMDGRSKDVPAALYRAYAVNPQHRLTLLELARWHGSRKAYGTAFSFYDQLQDKYPLDVEAAIERYVLGQSTGKDPAESQAVSTLAGLVRDEIPEVAKDEAGRAALAFGVAKLTEGAVQEALDELSKADAAFENSADFKVALGGVYLALGEWERAREHYKRALEIEPANPEHRIGLARAALGERSGEKINREVVRKQAAKADEQGVAKLPFGTVRFVFDHFAHVKTELDRDFFPEAEYAALAAKDLAGADLQKALEAASLRALARRKLRARRRDEAITLLRESAKLIDDVRTEHALGVAYIAKEDYDEGIRILANAVESDEGNVAARVALAKAYVAKKDEAKALQVLDDLADDVVAPSALLLVSRLKVDRADFEGAIEKTEQLVKLQPGNAAAHLIHGEALLRLNRNDEADQSFVKAIEAEPRLAGGDAPRGLERLTPWALLGLGRAEMARNERRGIGLLRSAAAMEEAPAEVHFHLGKALLQNRRTRREGKKELERYVRLAAAGEMRNEAERLLRRR